MNYIVRPVAGKDFLKERFKIFLLKKRLYVIVYRNREIAVNKSI